jgi:DNA-binding MarR family transcriptional regulator
MDNTTAFIEMRAVNHLVMRYLDRNFLSREPEKVNVGNAWIIGYICANKDKDIYQKDIEERFLLTRSTVSKVVDYMVSKGLIERKSVKNDARLRKLVLTDKAAGLAERMKECEVQATERMFCGFSEEDKTRFVGYLEKIKNNIEDRKREETDI